MQNMFVNVISWLLKIGKILMDFRVLPSLGWAFLQKDVLALFLAKRQRMSGCGTQEHTDIVELWKISGQFGLFGVSRSFKGSGSKVEENTGFQL